MRKYFKLILFFLITLYMGCDDEESSGASINEDYVGKWVLTFSANYDGQECAGDIMGSGDGTVTNGTTFITLNDDGSYLSTDAFFCPDPDNMNNDFCKGTWSSSGSEISIGFVTYTIISGTDTTMTSELPMEVTSNGVSSNQCSKTIYTKE